MYVHFDALNLMYHRGGVGVVGCNSGWLDAHTAPGVGQWVSSRVHRADGGYANCVLLEATRGQSVGQPVERH